MGRIVKLEIAWDGSTRYLDILPPTKVDVATLSSLEFNSGEPYQPYNPFGKTTHHPRLSEPCTSLDRVKYAWNNEQITEWRQRLDYIHSSLVRKTFESSTQFYAGVRHEREVMHKKRTVEIFLAMHYSLRNVLRNKETFSVDVVEDTHAGKTRWGIVFYGVKSKLLAYNHLGSKKPTGTSTLYALGKFIAEHGIPGKIITDSDGKLGAGKAWKNYLGRLFVPLSLSEPDKHNQDFVERAIQNLKAGLSKTRNACGAEVLAYHWEAMEYLCSLNNYVARASLNNRLTYEDFWGETPNISMIHFKFWELVYYRNWTEKDSKVLMHPRRFMGFAWDVGDPMTFKVLQCHANMKRWA